MARDFGLKKRRKDDCLCYLTALLLRFYKRQTVIVPLALATVDVRHHLYHSIQVHVPKFATLLHANTYIHTKTKLTN